MNKTTSPAIQRRWQELLDNAPVPEWVQKMQDHYRKTGTFRPEDLRRLLGDPNEGVEVGPDSNLAGALAQHSVQHGK